MAPPPTTTAASASASASASSPAYSTSQMEEVWSWVHDERRCVTAKSVSLELGVTRRVASAVLADLPTHHRSSSSPGAGKVGYEVNVCRVVLPQDGSGRAAVKLVKETITADEIIDLGSGGGGGGTVYSIALIDDGGTGRGAPTVQTAHERTMATLRDMVLDDAHDGSVALDPTLHCDDVMPSVGTTDGRGDDDVPVRRADFETIRNRRIAASLPAGVAAGNPFGASSSSSSSLSKVKKAAPSRKTTSAASFFGSTASSSSGAKKGGGGTSTKSSKAGQAKVTKAKGPNKINFGKKKVDTATKEEKKEAAATKEDGKENQENVTAAQKSKKSKGSSGSSSAKRSKKTSSSSKVASECDQDKARGNADDFVGDEDEDDDFVKEDAERKQRIADASKESKKKVEEERKMNAPAARRRAIADDDDCDDDDDDDDAMIVDEEDGAQEKHSVYGAMDAFVKDKEEEEGSDDPAQPQGGGQSKKRRRKKLVEKTTMDDKGYIFTETVTVWEDVPSDEEDEGQGSGSGGSPQKKLKPSSSVPKAKKAPAKSTKGMKQAGLMGFFSKKG